MKKKNYLSLFILGALTLFTSQVNAQLGTPTQWEMHFGNTLNTSNQDGFLKFVTPAPAYQPNYNVMTLKTFADASPVNIGGNHVYFVPDGFAGVFSDIEANTVAASGTYSRVFMPGQVRIGTMFTGWDNWKLRIETHPTNATFINGMLIDHRNNNGWSFGFLMKVNHDETKALVVENQLVGGPNKEVFKVKGSGRLYCTEAHVKLPGTFPDYVFDPSYNLMSLSELEEFITTKKHLPGIPSAKEVEEEGSIAIGEMQKALLEKVEELTLYILQQQHKIEALSKEIDQLKNR